MLITLSIKATKQELKKAMLPLGISEKKKSLKDFFGKLKSKEDGLSVQKKLRDEWN